MGSGNTAKSTWGTRAARSILTLVAAATVAAPVFADVTHVTVRFRDAATGTAAADDVARMQAIASTVRTGIGSSSVTRDGAYRIGLAPPLGDAGARAALVRLRERADVLYAEAEPAAAPVPASHDASALPVAQIIVKYRDPLVAAQAAADQPLAPLRLTALEQRAARPLAFVRNLTWAGAHVIALMQRVPVGEAEAIAAAIEQDPDVEYAEADRIMLPQLVPNDPLWFQQWHYMTPAAFPGAANLPAAWDLTTGWSGVRVGVIDTGSLLTHPDFANRFLPGYDFLTNVATANDGNARDADPSDPGDWTSPGQCSAGWPGSNSSWHGSHVAGTIAAATNNATGVAGINWTSRIVTLRGLGVCGGPTSDIADAMVWGSGGAVAGVPANPFPARTLNMSLGGGGACGATFQNAVNSALSRNTSVIVAAGNSNADAANFSPASCNGVLTVAAVGQDGQRAPYSNYGTVVEIAAPGGAGGDGEPTVLSIVNTSLTSPGLGTMGYGTKNGTSMATPHVAGIASLIYSLKPSLTPAQLTNVLQATARTFPVGTGRDCTTMTCGAGLVDAALAVTNILATGGPGGTALLASSALVSTTPNPSNQGVTVTLNASVAGASGNPTGSVTFTDGDMPIAGCIDVALPATVGSPKPVQCTTSALPIGARTIRAVYSGDAAHRPTDSPTHAHSVVPGAPQPTTTNVNGTPNPALSGASVTFIATVTGVAPTGTVDFRANGTSIAGCAAVALAGVGDVRTAQCVTSALPVAQNAIAAIYSGDAANLTSTGTASHGIYTPSSCSTFNDVPGADPFCPNVQWLYNRGITQGCDNVTFCKDATVTRLQMAAFMNRTGTALSPIELPLVAGETSLSLGGANTFTCFNNAASVTVTGFPRRARLRAFANVYNPSVATEVVVRFAYSTNGGTTWSLIPPQQAGIRLALADDQTANLTAEVDLAVGQTYVFGLAFTASPAATVGIYCANQARIFNRNGTVVPY